jgi:hypothetical protein
MSQAEVEMPHDDNDPFVKKVALSVAVFAVVLALAASGGKSAGGETMMNQLKASNEWARYQAKVQREVAYMQEREVLDDANGPVPFDTDEAKALEEAKQVVKGYEDAQKDRAKLPADPTERKKLRHKFVTAKLIEYKDDKRKLQEDARKCEADRDLAIKRGPFFDTAELLLQIGIVLLSVAMLSKARWAFLAGLVLAVGGLALTVMGYFTPEVQIPLLTPAEPTTPQT